MIYAIHFLFLLDAEYETLLRSCELNLHPPNMHITYRYQELKVRPGSLDEVADHFSTRPVFLISCAMHLQFCTNVTRVRSNERTLKHVHANTLAWRQRQETLMSRQS